MNHLTTKQVKGMLGYSLRTIYRLIERGILNPRQPSGPGGELRFDPEEVEAVAQRRRGEAA